MIEVVRDAAAMVAGMDPWLDERVFVFATSTDPGLSARAAAVAIGMFMEPEGCSFILTADAASDLGFAIDQPMRCISLRVYSALDGVGLTAAVASALAARDIPCNMVAAFHHDHVFVPAAAADEAIVVLRALQQRAGEAMTG